MSNAVYEVLLEKKGRGRSFMGRPWAVRTFKLKEQNLEYYDGDKLKGTISIAGSKTGKIPPEEADGKTFPFAVATKEEKLILNASCEEIRLRCIEIFNYAATDKSWTLQPKSPPPAPPVEVDEVQQKIEKTQEEFDTAATAAVAAVFAENAEKARLEEEQKQLEEQRLRQATEAAAKLMEEELANKKLREAKEAEKKQQEEQERQVMNLLKGLGAKARFKTALQHGKLSVAREAAATMVQGAYRAKIAHRNMLKKKAEKDRLRREAYAKKIQCRYRTRLARRKMEKIKAEKLAIKLKLMAMRIQVTYCCVSFFLSILTPFLSIELLENIHREKEVSLEARGEVGGRVPEKCGEATICHSHADLYQSLLGKATSYTYQCNLSQRCICVCRACGRIVIRLE